MATKKATKKTTATKTKAKATKAKAKDNGQDVTFTDDIPKVTREFGGSRTSKYDELLNTLVERAEAGESSTARMVFDSVGKATSRYQSIKTAIEKRDDDAFMFDVAQRTEGENERSVYVKYDPDAEPEDEDATDQDDEDEELDDEDVEF